MYRRIGAAVVILGVTVLIVRFVRNQPNFSDSQPTTNLKQSITPTTSPNTQASTVTYNQSTYSYQVLGPLKSNQIQLYSNLPDKKLAIKLKEDKQCQYVTSAGFYNESDQHIGLFISRGEIISQSKPNTLFNQYLYSTAQGEAGISHELPTQAMDFALQTGPLLLSDSQPRRLSLRVDEEARRLVAGITAAGDFYFISLVEPDNAFTGPTLEDLPYLVDLINQRDDLQIVSAVNLDGGSHSVFISKDTSLQELSPVGGIFCITE